MKQTSFQQFAIVVGDSAQSLTDQLNAKLIELRHKHPIVTFEGLIARIQYEDSLEDPECIGDEYSQIGVKLTCQDCPMFSPTTKKDGSADGRARYGYCPHNKYGKVYRNATACEKLYQMLNDGRVVLCLAK